MCCMFGLLNVFMFGVLIVLYVWSVECFVCLEC